MKWFETQFEQDQWDDELINFKFRLTRQNACAGWVKSEINLACGHDFYLHIPLREALETEDIYRLKDLMTQMIEAEDFQGDYSPTEPDFEFEFHRDSENVNFLWKIFFCGGMSDSLIKLEFDKEQTLDLLDYLEEFTKSPDI